MAIIQSQGADQREYNSAQLGGNLGDTLGQLISSQHPIQLLPARLKQPARVIQLPPPSIQKIADSSWVVIHR